ncbi:MAG: MBL fold metallo-hydrolase [Paracoccaceae bacterium]|nr:MBL fold metallo-hydrolase [Paracoccaceae bacterium]
MPKDTEARVIAAAHILTSGKAGQHPEHRFGSRKPQLWWVLFSRRWVEIPLTYVAIEHKDGLVLFDTGLDPAIESDPTYISQWIGRVLLKRIFRLEIGPDEALDKKLARIGLNAHDVKKAVISHLHFDHMGGIKHIPQADLIVSKREWDILSEPHPEREWILREHIEIEGAKWRPVSFAPTDDPALAAFGEAYDVPCLQSSVFRHRTAR